MGWRSTEVGINLGGGVKIVNHLMLSCYYNIGLTQSAKHHIGGNKHDAIDQIFDGDVFESKKQVLAVIPFLCVLVEDTWYGWGCLPFYCLSLRPHLLIDTDCLKLLDYETETDTVGRGAIPCSFYIDYSLFSYGDLHMPSWMC